MSEIGLLERLKAKYFREEEERGKDLSCPNVDHGLGFKATVLAFAVVAFGLGFSVFVGLAEIVIFRTRKIIMEI